MKTYKIAKCPKHGLHGEREECFVCGGPVEQVEMVPVVAMDRPKSPGFYTPMDIAPGEYPVKGTGGIQMNLHDEILKRIEAMWDDTGTGGDLNIADDHNKLNQATAALEELVKREVRKELEYGKRITSGGDFKAGPQYFSDRIEALNHEGGEND